MSRSFKLILSFTLAAFFIPAAFICCKPAAAQTLNDILNNIGKGNIFQNKHPAPATPSKPSNLSAAAVRTTGKGVVTDQDPAGLNVRTAPGGNIIGKIFYNDKVEIIAREGEWCKIKFMNGTGYVYGAYISGPAPAAAASQNDLKPQAPTKDEAWQKAFTAVVDPWVKEGVVFKFGGYDSLYEYK